ncbi:MAG: cobalamin-dependent protein [Candidatus Micrarchaeota archaeon]|nr:cobalamin-dependent protein [Candidatus Micrarchaeota archaeon]
MQKLAYLLKNITKTKVNGPIDIEGAVKTFGKELERYLNQDNSAGDRIVGYQKALSVACCFGSELPGLTDVMGAHAAEFTEVFGAHIIQNAAGSADQQKAALTSLDKIGEPLLAAQLLLAINATAEHIGSLDLLTGDEFLSSLRNLNKDIAGSLLYEIQLTGRAGELTDARLFSDKSVNFLNSLGKEAASAWLSAIAKTGNIAGLVNDRAMSDDVIAVIKEDGRISSWLSMAIAQTGKEELLTDREFLNGLVGLEPAIASEYLSAVYCTNGHDGITGAALIDDLRKGKLDIWREVGKMLRNANGGDAPMIVLSKAGEDGHDLGLKGVARELVSSGFNVTFTGDLQDPKEIARIAAIEGAVAVGFGIMGDSYHRVVLDTRKEMKVNGLGDVAFFTGGMITQSAATKLEERGIFTAGMLTEAAGEKLDRRGVKVFQQGQAAGDIISYLAGTAMAKDAGASVRFNAARPFNLGSTIGSVTKAQATEQLAGSIVAHGIAQTSDLGVSSGQGHIWPALGAKAMRPFFRFEQAAAFGDAFISDDGFGSLRKLHSVQAEYAAADGALDSKFWSAIGQGGMFISIGNSKLQKAYGTAGGEGLPISYGMADGTTQYVLDSEKALISAAVELASDKEQALKVISTARMQSAKLSTWSYMGFHAYYDAVSWNAMAVQNEISRNRAGSEPALTSNFRTVSGREAKYDSSAITQMPDGGRQGICTADGTKIETVVFAGLGLGHQSHESKVTGVIAAIQAVQLGHAWAPDAASSGAAHVNKQKAMSYQLNAAGDVGMEATKPIVNMSMSLQAGAGIGPDAASYAQQIATWAIWRSPKSPVDAGTAKMLLYAAPVGEFRQVSSKNSAQYELKQGAVGSDSDNSVHRHAVKLAEADYGHGFGATADQEYRRQAITLHMAEKQFAEQKALPAFAQVAYDGPRTAQNNTVGEMGQILAAGNATDHTPRMINRIVDAGQIVKRDAIAEPASDYKGDVVPTLQLQTRAGAQNKKTAPAIRISWDYVAPVSIAFGNGAIESSSEAHGAAPLALLMHAQSVNVKSVAKRMDSHQPILTERVALQADGITTITMDYAKSKKSDGRPDLIARLVKKKPIKVCYCSCHWG